MDGLGSSMALGGGDQKTAVMNQVRQEAALTNARQLIEVRNTSPAIHSPLLYPPLIKHIIPILTTTQKVNEHCFEKCIPKPGSSLSSGDTTCLTQCMEKYMATWNTVSRQYINRIQQESGKGAGAGGMF